MRQQRAFSKAQLTRDQAHTQLVVALTNCPDRKLATMTVEGICRMFRVTGKTAEYEITRERNMRARSGFEL